MDKWADYLISEVSYDYDHLIYAAIRHQDTDKGITKGKPVDRLTIASDIKNGLFYITIFSGKDSWKKGHKIRTFSIGGNPYLRIDENKVKLDYLGDLPETSIPKPEPVKELEFQPEPTSEPDMEPEEKSTSEQLAQLEQLEKQIQEFESQQSIQESSSSSRGSLPKGFTKEPPQEQTSELEEATSEQLERLEQLEKQIQEFESQQSITESTIISIEEEATSEQLERLEQLEKQIQEFESQQSIQESSSSSRGSLPKGFTKEPPQEPEPTTEPVTETEPSQHSRGSLPKGFTKELPREIEKIQRDTEKSKRQLLEEYENEYLERIEQDKIAQEKEHQEALEAEVSERSSQIHGNLPKGFEPTTEPVTETEPSQHSRGSLPKGFTKEPTQEPEPTTELEEEATPEQLAQFNDLQQQIDELEDMLSFQILPESQSEEEEEATPEQLAQFNDLQQQIDELEYVLSTQLSPSSDEPTPEQLSRVKKLEKEIQKLESIDIEQEIIQTLQKQNKKLDDIEKKLHGSTTSKKHTLESNFPQAYCVKCKTKRKIENPEETTMKNGRAAIKGFCSVCNCKVFRIGKIKK